MTPILLVLPFLPAGRGALILILGGLLVLPFALLFSRPARPAPPARPAAPRRGRRAGAVLEQDRPPAPSQPGQRVWAGTGLERALRQAVGWTELLAAEPGHYVVQLGNCSSCARSALGCEAERDALARAVEPYLRQATVAERACAQWGARACAFDIRGR